jgi:T-complex protein 1 subunit beta
MRMALEVEQLALSEKGKESIAIESFARALKQLPTIITDNAGLDSAEIVSNLRNAIYNGNHSAGINIYEGTIGDMKELGIYECLKVKEQALISACEACEMILRVDMTVTCQPRQRDRE